MKYKVSGHLNNILGSILNPLAIVARVSAKHPIQVITISLLLFSISYLSLIQSAIQEWNNILSNVNVPVEFQNNILLRESVHYYRGTTEAQWIKLSLDDFNKVSQYKNNHHLYLYPIDFEGWNFKKQDVELKTFLNGLNDSLHAIYENKFYLVKENFILPSKLLKDDFKITHWEPTISIESLIISLQKIRLFFDHMLQTQRLEFTDLTFVFGSYSILIYTIFNMFIDLKRMGSKMWLAFALLLNLSCACCISISITKSIFDIHFSIFTLIQGLPFLIITIGFKNKINLSKYVLERFRIINISRKITIDSIIFDAIKKEGIHLLKSYILLSMVLIMAILLFPSQKILRNFSILSCLILLVDFILTISFYSSILSLKMDIYTINQSTVNRDTLKEECSSRVSLTNLTIADREPQRSFLISNKNVKIAKLAIILFIIVINMYSVDFQWILNTLHSLYLQLFNDKSLPSFVTNNPDLVDTLITIFPTQYYRYKDNISYETNSVNITLHLLKILGSTVSDQFMSKVIFIILLASVSTNIYLLKVARIYTKSTIQSTLKRTNSRESFVIPPNYISSRSFNHKSRTHSPLSFNPVTYPTFSLTPTSDDESPESSGTSTPLGSADTSLDYLDTILKSCEGNKLQLLDDNKIIGLVLANKLSLYSLEEKLGDKLRAIEIRRAIISILTKTTILRLSKLPYKNYNYDRVFGACCENVVGYVPIPVGIVGPLLIDGELLHIPMATTEGCLVASTTRGCKAINAGGGVTTILTKDSMTRGPCVKFPNLVRAGACKMWLDSDEGRNAIKNSFDSTSRFARLQNIKTAITGNILFIRFCTTTGDAMGMNMISKGVEHCLEQMINIFGWDDMKVISISGNYCVDKKAAAINWIEGRGKSVVAEAVISGDIVTTVLKSDVKSMVDVNITKNLIGSAVSGAVGGFNAHASNIVTALFIALGQDVAQNIESSNCITLMSEENGDLRVSVTMPSIEVGTIGGGTILEPQETLLDMLGIRGSCPSEPGNNAKKLARIVASVVLAGEVSLCAALASGHLVKSHMKLNRNRSLKSKMSKK